MVSITYVGNGDWGLGKGGPLSQAEFDGNLYEIAQAITDLQGGGGPAEIDQITVSGSQMTVVLTDARVLGPYTLPRAVFSWRGDWAPATQYFGNDIVRVDGVGIYLVGYDHTSEASFDPLYILTGEGGGAYQLMFSGDLEAIVEADASVFTVSAGVSRAYVRCTDVGGCAVTLPSTATAAHPIGARHRFRVSGGAVTFAADTGVSIDLPAGKQLAASAAGAVVEFVKVAAEAWDALGDLDAV